MRVSGIDNLLDVIAKLLETTNLMQAGWFRPKGRFTQHLGIMV
jgi:hypothetical protein